MNVFWREQPLSEEEAELYRLVLEAHHYSAFRGNVSGQAVAMAAAGSGDYFKAVAGGLMTLGNTHGPIEETMRFLMSQDLVGRTRVMLNMGIRIPGWGNSFIKGRKDDLWVKVDDCLAKYFVKTYARLNQVTEVLKVDGKDLYPNPSAYTAAAAIIFGIPVQISAYLLVAGRLAAWTQLAADNLRSK